MRNTAIVAAGLLILASGSAAQSVPKQDQLRKTTSDGCANLPLLEKQIEGMETQLRDWPELAHYAKDNAKFSPPAKDEQRVVFLGDSITEGWSNPQSGGFFPGKPYVNRGISSQTTPQMLVRFRPDVIALQPKVVVILAGINDIAGNTGPMTLEETEGNLATMSELAHAHGIRVVLSSVMPVNDVTKPNGEKSIETVEHPPEKILRLNEWIKAYAKEHGDVYLDYYSAVVNDKGLLKSDLSYDGIHPHAQGYAVMAPLAEKAIQEALAQQP